jgi:hypothetical protein
VSDDAAALRQDAARVAAMELQLKRSQVEPAYFHGYLMLPLLREGDEVEVEPIAGDDARVGDVVTYRDTDKFPTRRVMEIREHGRLLVIMGDSVRPRRTWLVPADDVLGRVVRRRRDGAWMTTRDWRWRLQRHKVVLRYRVGASPIGDVVRRLRRGARRGA